MELCPLAAKESTDDKRLFESWEELDDYLHSHYGYGVEIESCTPSTSDVNCLKMFYDSASGDDKFMIESSWYKHSLFMQHRNVSNNTAKIPSPLYSALSRKTYTRPNGSVAKSHH